MLPLAALLVCALVVLALGVVTMTLRRSTTGLASLSESLSYTDEVGIIAAPSSVPIAKAGTLTVRTSNVAGSLTMGTGHGITTGQRVDLYWAGGQCYGATVGTVAGNVVPITAVSGGDVLPAAASPITVGIATQVDFNCVGADLTAIAFNCPASRNYFVFATSVPGDISPPLYAVGPSIHTWADDDPSLNANPLVGASAVSVWMSHADVDAAQTTMSVQAATH